MRAHWEPLERQPVSVHAPLISYPGGRYRHADTEQRRTALLAACHGVSLGAYDERLLRWLAGWDVPALVVSLLWRARHAATRDTHRGGGESR